MSGIGAFPKGNNLNLLGIGISLSYTNAPDWDQLHNFRYVWISFSFIAWIFQLAFLDVQSINFEHTPSIFPENTQRSHLPISTWTRQTNVVWQCVGNSVFLAYFLLLPSKQMKYLYQQLGWNWPCACWST